MTQAIRAAPIALKHRPSLSRRLVLALPLLLASCGGEETRPPQYFPPLDFSYLLPLPLNVASIDVVDRSIPAVGPSDVSTLDPVPPAEALRLMARQRLKADGTSGRAVFVIQQASITRLGDTVTGIMSVRLEIYPTPDMAAGYAEATVTRSVSGNLRNLPAVLYGLTRQMMDEMNVEFEYQVRHSLAQWLLPPGAATTPVQTAPLEAPTPSTPSGPSGSSPAASAPSAAPSASSALPPTVPGTPNPTSGSIPPPPSAAPPPLTPPASSGTP